MGSPIVSVETEVWAVAKEGVVGGVDRRPVGEGVGE